MFHSKRSQEPLHVNFLKENSPYTATSIVDTFTHYDRKFESTDFIPIADSNVNYVSIRNRGMYQFNDILELHATDKNSHMVSLSEKTSIDVYFSPEINTQITQVIAQSAKSRISLNDGKLPIKIIDDIKMLYYGTLSIKEFFGLELFKTSISTDMSFIDGHNTFVPFTINKIKYKSQYKIVDNKIMIYVS